VHEEKINFVRPTLDLLDIGKNENYADDEELQRNGRILQEKLQTFKINISNLEVTRGPVVTQYEFVPADGVKINKIEGLADDLAMALKAKSVHIIAPVPEKGTVGIQIPNSNPSIVRFRSVASSHEFVHTNFELPIALGKTVAGEPYIADLSKMPHLLIAGSTGAGKSVGINTIIASLLYKKHPSQLKFIIIDPKKVELTHYARLSSHFLAVSPDINTEIVTEPQDAITILKAATLEMEKRYTLLEIAKQRNIKDYNEKVKQGAFKDDIVLDHRELPYIVVIVDELADLMLTAGKEIELPIVRLAQMARAVGIHLIIATQRPSVNVITGIIKANFPARIAYLVAQKVDSRTILDSSGAEALLGNGDMLFNAANQPKAIRIQNPFISTDEVERLCDFIGNQEGYSEPYLLPSTFEAGNEGEFDVSSFDPLFMEAAELIISHQQASTSMLQRRLKIGFARAGRLMDELAAANVVGPPQGSKPRAILIESMSELEKII
jgi:S-DNA-T family DNA segregation ATPase FtsK/SpoIIIE